MRRSCTLLLLSFQLAACTWGIPPSPVNSGVEGQVLIGPLCPVMVEGLDCPDGPYQATLTVLDRKGKTVARFKTDEGGIFRVPLAPGEYILIPETPEGMPYPIADRQEFAVLPGKFTPIIVSYDSGIR